MSTYNRIRKWPRRIEMFNRRIGATHADGSTSGMGGNQSSTADISPPQTTSAPVGAESAPVAEIVQNEGAGAPSASAAVMQPSSECAIVSPNTAANEHCGGATSAPTQQLSMSTAAGVEYSPLAPNVQCEGGGGPLSFAAIGDPQYGTDLFPWATNADMDVAAELRLVGASAEFDGIFLPLPFASLPSNYGAALRPLGDIVNHEALLESFKWLRLYGGQGRGPDGVGYWDHSIGEVAKHLKQVSRSILNREYRPGPSRVVSIPKASGGTRELRLRSIFDRVVARAVYKAVGPVIDPSFLDCSFGFRPNLSVGHLLAALRRSLTTGGNTWVIHDDISTAFDAVVIDEVVADFRRHIHDPDLLDLIEKICRGPDSRKVHGIDQGSPLSPLCLNVHLHHRLDVPLLAACPNRYRYFRYADDLVITGASEPECRAARQQAAHLLDRAGLCLKGKCPQPLNLLRMRATADALQTA